jgi:murein L,D-transpeptidase YcbB/YkuD
VFDAQLARALKRFKARHGLHADAVLDKPTIAALNAPVEERIRQLELNLERWRWLPRQRGDRYVLVNVPSFELRAYEHGREALQMRVVTGDADETPTPIFSEPMQYVVFSPYWNIPENILREETLPRVARDHDFLERNNIEVVGTSGTLDPGEIDWSDESITSNLRFRQRPGPDNALGLVKFIFPNHFNIYLHDTPTDRLFARPHRAFSHGCIRIENPVGLAEYVLRDQPQWTAQRITTAMNAGHEQHVKLKQPLPVHIGYWTAWVEPDGSVTYTDDPYHIDEGHARVLTKAPPREPLRAATRSS